MTQVEPTSLTNSEPGTGSPDAARRQGATSPEHAASHTSQTPPRLKRFALRGSALTILLGAAPFLYGAGSLFPTLNQLLPSAPSLKAGVIVGAWLLSLPITSWIAFGVRQAMVRVAGFKALDEETDRWTHTLVGLADHTMYLAAFVVNKPEFIPFWLGYKLLAVWRGYTGEDPSIDSRESRRRYNVNVVNNALRLLLAGGTYIAMLVLSR